MTIRSLAPGDYDELIGRLDGWWGDRPVSRGLPRLFFEHFRDTSFAIEEDGRLIAFLVGFVSQSDPRQGYIHFVGVHPDHRRAGLGRLLYEQFFEAARARGCTTVGCITSPVNRASIAYHRAMGFELEPGDMTVDGIPFHCDHDGPGQDRVRFVRAL